MERPEQEMAVTFSQMLQLFPNVPRDIIWIYVQRYSSDIEKCTQMLNLQNGKYTGINSSPLNNNKYLNEHNILIQPSHVMPSSKTVHDNNNEINLINLPAEQLSLKTDEVTNVANEGTSSKKTECLTINAQCLCSSPLGSSNALHESVASVHNSSRLVNRNSSKFPETLALHIKIDDDDGYVHNWRPNLCADVLGSDFFIASPLFENLSSVSHVSNMNTQCSKPEIHARAEDVNHKPFNYDTTPIHLYQDYPQHNVKAYGIDIASYLHYQKSQMNSIQYEVIKAKIALSELKDNEERLLSELKEKMQSKSVQDIEKLNEEIVQLRLDCQCLCTEVDCSQNDPVLLGEVDEKYYKRRNNSVSSNAEIQNPASDHSVSSQNGNSIDIVDESCRWSCPQCTFANHPAINVCELCHKPKPRNPNPPYVALAPSSCYCHPKEDSLSVQS